MTWFMRVLGHREDSEAAPPSNYSDRSGRGKLSSLRFQRPPNAPIVLSTLDYKGTTQEHTRASLESVDREDAPNLKTQDLSDGRSRKSLTMTFGGEAV